MTNLKKIILFFVFCMFIETSSAVTPVSVETKVFGKNVVFIFHHDRDQVIDFIVKNGTVTAEINVPSEFKILNSEQFKRHAHNVTVHSDRQKFTFSFDKELRYRNVINGEKLDAIKFIDDKTKDEDLSKIGKAENDPGTIKYDKHNDEHVLSINLGNDASKIAAFFKEKYLWIILDQKKNLSFSENNIFSKFETIASEKGTVIRLLVNPKLDKARVEKIPSGWSVSVSTKEVKQAKGILIPKALPDQNGIFIKGNFVKDEIITFEDPEPGDLIAALPVNVTNFKIDIGWEEIEYNLLKTLQGLAIVLLSDDALIEKHVEGIKIISNTNLPENELPETENSYSDIIDNLIKLPSILPHLDKNLDILDFNQQKSRLISEASSYSDNRDAFMKNFALAKFYFINRWYSESLDALLLAKQFSPNDYKLALQARFLTAVNYTMTRNYEAAQEVYDELLLYPDLKRIAEINLWYSFNKYKLGANNNSIGLLNILSKTLSLYSDDKYWPLVFAEMELALQNNELKTLEKIFKEIRVPTEYNHINSLKYYKANYYRKKGQLNLAKQYYKELITQDLDLENSIRAEFDLTKLQIADRDINSAEAIKILERLRFSWRGDRLEYDILIQTANLYREQNDILNALRIYQYAQQAFNDKVSNFYLTSEMAKIFNDVFLPGGSGENMDDFTLVALFYEFKELNPIGDQGDDVILSIAKRLVKLDLLDNAIDLLRHQVTYRLKNMKRVVNADNLAVILIINNKPREAILILEETDKDNFNFSEHQYRVRLKARALIALGKLDEAFDFLKDDDSPDAEIIKREIIFQQKNWGKYIDRVAPDFDNLINRMDSDDSAVQDILRLSICYYMLNNHDQLVEISKGIGDKHSALKTTVDLLISGSGTINYKDLDRSLNIDQMKNLLDKYKNQFLAK